MSTRDSGLETENGPMRGGQGETTRVRREACGSWSFHVLPIEPPKAMPRFWKFLRAETVIETRKQKRAGHRYNLVLVTLTALFEVSGVISQNKG